MKRVVIVGAGFAGLTAAKELRHSDAEVFVVKRITTYFSLCSIKWRRPCFLWLKSGVQSVDF
jgi:succinate dehydrogenase/fumarate reductase flavoprotein subunit